MTFTYRDTDGDCLDVEPDCDDQGNPVIYIHADDVHVPLDRVEEVVAGIRDMARQAAAQQPAESRTADVSPTAVLLASQCDACRHTLNWHTNYAGCTVVRTEVLWSNRELAGQVDLFAV